MDKTKEKSFKEKYKPDFDYEKDEWTLQVPANDVIKKSDDYYEIKLPFYVSKVLAPGGNILREPRKKYRDWLLNEQGGKCAICSKGYIPDTYWNLDHQPQLNASGSRFIDYKKITRNRVIHQRCDPAQTKKKRD